MIDDAITEFMRFWRFITSDPGVQWVYLALCVLHALLSLDRWVERWFTKKGIAIDPPQSALIIANWLCALVFFLSVLINGENPRLSRVVMMPYSRFVWFLVAISLAVCVFLKTWRLLVVVRFVRRGEVSDGWRILSAEQAEQE